MFLILLFTNYLNAFIQREITFCGVGSLGNSLITLPLSINNLLKNDLFEKKINLFIFNTHKDFIERRAFTSIVEGKNIVYNTIYKNNLINMLELSTNKINKIEIIDLVFDNSFELYMNKNEQKILQKICVLFNITTFTKESTTIIIEKLSKCKKESIDNRTANCVEIEKEKNTNKQDFHTIIQYILKNELYNNMKKKVLQIYASVKCLEYVYKNYPENKEIFVIKNDLAITQEINFKQTHLENIDNNIVYVAYDDYQNIDELNFLFGNNYVLYQFLNRFLHFFCEQNFCINSIIQNFKEFLKIEKKNAIKLFELCQTAHHDPEIQLNNENPGEKELLNYFNLAKFNNIFPYKNMHTYIPNFNSLILYNKTSYGDTEIELKRKKRIESTETEMQNAKNRLRMMKNRKVYWITTWYTTEKNITQVEQTRKKEFEIITLKLLNSKDITNLIFIVEIGHYDELIVIYNNWKKENKFSKIVMFLEKPRLKICETFFLLEKIILMDNTVDMLEINYSDYNPNDNHIRIIANSDIYPSKTMIKNLLNNEALTIETTVFALTRWNVYPNKTEEKDLIYDCDDSMGAKHFGKSFVLLSVL